MTSETAKNILEMRGFSGKTFRRMSGFTICKKRRWF